MQHFRKKITNSEIITALAEHDSVSAAAASLGIDRSTIYRRMKDSDYHKEYQNAISVASQEATHRMLKMVNKAIAVYEKLLEPEGRPTKLELQAAQEILKFMEKYVDNVLVESKLTELEAIAKKRQG